MQTVINDLLINYEFVNQKSKNNLIILHGWGRNLNDWKNFANQLTKQNTYLIDLPGFGNSTYSPKLQNSQDYINIVDKFIYKLEINNISILGHSYGGKLATLLTSQNQSINKLIIVASPGVEKKSFLATIKIVIFKILKHIKYFLPNKLNYKIFTFLATSDYQNSGQLRSLFKNIIKEDIINDLKKIKTDTLIIWGDKDDQISVANSKIFRRNIKNSIIRIVWGAGHHPHLDKPKFFLEIVDNFL